MNSIWLLCFSPKYWFSFHPNPNQALCTVAHRFSTLAWAASSTFKVPFLKSTVAPLLGNRWPKLPALARHDGNHLHELCRSKRQLCLLGHSFPSVRQEGVPFSGPWKRSSFLQQHYVVLQKSIAEEAESWLEEIMVGKEKWCSLSVKTSLAFFTTAGCLDLTELGVISDTGLHQWVSGHCFAEFPRGLWEAVRFQVPTFCFSLFLFIPLFLLLFFYCQLCCSIVNNILQGELSLINWAETRAKKVPRESLENNGCGGSKDGKWDSWVWGPSSAHMCV